MTESQHFASNLLTCAQLEGVNVRFHLVVKLRSEQLCVVP